MFPIAVFRCSVQNDYIWNVISVQLSINNRQCAELLCRMSGQHIQLELHHDLENTLEDDHLIIMMVNLRMLVIRINLGGMRLAVWCYKSLF